MNTGESKPSPSGRATPTPPKGVSEQRSGRAGPAPAHGGMIVREAEPLNLEMPFGALDEYVTRTGDFFVRSHFAIPEINPGQWRLHVSGRVRQSLALTRDEVQAMPATTITATLECAGNGRVFLNPKVTGVQWERGAVGNAEWTGVRLDHVLGRAGVEADAHDLILKGADKGKPSETPLPGGEIHYARSVPVSMAAQVLLAWAMNGEPLTPGHGSPLRAIVPGWYGMASVKWLSDIIVSPTPFRGYFQSIDYAFWERPTGEPSRVPITEMQVKAQIARPGPAEVIAAGSSYLVRGAAWSGDAGIVRVELSTDGGAHWSDTRLGDLSAPGAWRLWEFEWGVPATPGKATLVVRATDSKGRTQPAERDADRGGYIVNEVMGMDVFVR